MGGKKSTRVSLNESGYTIVYSKDQERWTVARPKRVTDAMNDTEDVLEKAEKKERRRSNLYSVQEKGLPVLLIDSAACWRPLMVSARFG